MRTFVIDARGGGRGEAVRLSDAAALAALGDPLRIRILRRLAEPTSAKELAAELERPVTSLYHHLDLLEEHGLIHVVDVTKEGRALVRRYQRRGSRFESAVRRVSSAVHDTDSATDRAQRLRLVLRGPLDATRIGELGDRLQSVVTEFLGDRNRDDDATTYDVVITVSPTDEEDEG